MMEDASKIEQEEIIKKNKWRKKYDARKLEFEVLPS
jgi:hypothetical protein